jgi:hypothetical protein
MVKAENAGIIGAGFLESIVANIAGLTTKTKDTVRGMFEKPRNNSQRIRKNRIGEIEWTMSNLL